MKSVTVVGSGIIGLTSAIALQEAGCQVTIVAKERYENTLSNKVGAIWFPFEIYPKELANHWAVLSYSRYKLEEQKGNGVTFIPFISAYTSESNSDWIQQLPEGTVREATKEELPFGMETGHLACVPLAEPHLYLPHLFQRFLEHGGLFKQQTITSTEELSALDNWVINCTGLGAKVLCEDEALYPIRGQILRCAKLKTMSFADGTRKGKLCYVINRSKDSIIGGTDYENDWNTAIDVADTNLILHKLSGFNVHDEVPEIEEILVGLRPGRATVRFELDAMHPNLFHNYGHGGAGFTVAWGCALELAGIISSS